MEPEQHHSFPADDADPTAAADLRIEVTTIRRGRRLRRGQASRLTRLTSLTRLRNLLSRARP
jgi:hypothetical protein